MNRPKLNKFYSVRYCYQNFNRNSSIEAENRASSAQKISFLLLMTIALNILYLIKFGGLTIVIAILLIIFSMRQILFQRLTPQIDLNQIEFYLLNIPNIAQVVSLELYHVSPKIKVLRVRLTMTKMDIAGYDCLKKRINSDICHKFGITQTLIQMVDLSKMDNQIQPIQEVNLKNLISDVNTMELEFKRNLEVRKQSPFDLN